MPRQFITELSRTTDAFWFCGFLGKDVEVQANEIQLMNGASAPISYELVGDADEVVLQIMNDVGDVVRQIPQEARSQGHHNVLWDGMDNEGDPFI